MSKRSLSLTLLIAGLGAVALAMIPSEARGAGKVAGPPEVAWKDMTYAQKKAYMKSAVMPKMKTVFQEFDPKTFKKFDCATCHGKDGVERKFKMPSNGIHPLPNTPEAFQAKMKEEPTWPKWTKFMAEKVEPAMGTLLDVPVFDPKNPVKGAFGCGNCHKLEASPAKP
jgi:mono/diheme cytochrome c family protein